MYLLDMHKIMIVPALVMAGPVAMATEASDSTGLAAPSSLVSVAADDGASSRSDGSGGDGAWPVPEPWIEPPTDSDVFDGDYAIVGVGVGSLPTYEGSNNYKIMPAAGIMGSVGGVGFRLRGPSLTTDLIRNKKGSRIGFRAGPSVRWRGGRSGNLKDDVVERLPDLDGGLELGIGMGVSIKRVLTKYDSLSFGVSRRWDVSGKGAGQSSSISTSYMMPVSKAQIFGFQASAIFNNDKNARYSYDVTPEGSAASGLPVFNAKGGLNEINFGAFTARDLSGDFLDGGFAVGAGVMYSRLQGSAADTPITSIRGDADQWMFGGGVSYTF